jgi:hypothetical protein
MSATIHSSTKRRDGRPRLARWLRGRVRNADAPLLEDELLAARRKDRVLRLRQPDLRQHAAAVGEERQEGVGARRVAAARRQLALRRAPRAAALHHRGHPLLELVAAALEAARDLLQRAGSAAALAWGTGLLCRASRGAAYIRGRQQTEKERPSF